MADWFIDFNAWFLWPASIWVLAGSIAALAFAMFLLPRKFMSVFVIELRKDTNELRKDNAELKKQTERLTRQLEDNHEGIKNLYTILKQLHNFWFPYSREWK